MVKQASLLSRLESIVGTDGVSPAQELSAFAVDGLTPQAAVAPASYEQVAEVMRYAHTEGLAVIPWGGGTHMHIGNVPQRYDIALRLTRLDQMVEHEPADLTVTCQAGITLDALQRRLAEHGQLVPLGHAWGERATIGGILAANASGPSRHAYGAPRDFTIGLRVVTADGRLTRAGGRVVKNVAGYDLCKLYVGSLGTLGVIVEATFKVAPLPKAERTAIALLATVADACTFSAEVHRRGLSLRAVQLLNPAAASACALAPDGRCALVLELAGSPRAVERSWREIDALAAETAAELITATGGNTTWQRTYELTSGTAAVLLCKVSALPARLPALIDALEALESPRILALPTVGVCYAAWPDPSDAAGIAAQAAALASAPGGSVVVERCLLEIKRRLDVFPDASGPSFDLMRRVKERFDPRGALNPGRYLGRL